jgi:hypothetical protein
MRILQDWMGHRNLKTTLIYADYAPTFIRQSGLIVPSVAPPEIRSTSRRS